MAPLRPFLSPGLSGPTSFQLRFQSVSFTLSPAMQCLLILLPSLPDNPKPVSTWSLTVFPSDQNHPMVQVGTISVSRSLSSAGWVLAIPFHIPARASCFPVQATSHHHSTQSPYQAATLLKVYSPSFLPVLLVLHRSTASPNSNTTSKHFCENQSSKVCRMKRTNEIVYSLRIRLKDMFQSWSHPAVSSKIRWVYPRWVSPLDLWVFLFFPFIFISWRLITLQYCSGFCRTLTWISHGFTCIPHPDPPSHHPLHPIPLGLPSAPGPSTCLMHPAWAGDLFHPR